MLHNLRHHTAVQSQKTVSAYFTSRQTLLFGFAEQYGMQHTSVHSAYDGEMTLLVSVQG